MKAENRIYYIEGTQRNPGASYAYVGGSGGHRGATPIKSGDYAIQLEMKSAVLMNKGTPAEDIVRGTGIQDIPQGEDQYYSYTAGWGTTRARLFKGGAPASGPGGGGLYLHGGEDLSDRGTAMCIKAQEAIDPTNKLSLFDRVKNFMTGGHEGEMMDVTVQDK